MEKNVHNKRRFRFRTKIMLHEVQKCKKEKEKKNAITSSSIISNDSKNDGVNTIILKRKRRRGKKKKQKNGNSKSDKPKFNSQKHRNIQTNEKNSFGLNKQLVDTSTNIIISLANDKLNSSILRPQVKIIKKKMDKKPKSHNTNILENNNVVCTDKCQIKECLEFLLNCHDHQKKTYKDKKSKQKKKNKRNSKMVVQEKTEVSNEVIRHKYSKINEYLEKNAFESHSKEIYYDDHYSNCGMQTPRGNEKNPLLLKKLFKNKKKKKKKVFKDVTQKEIIPPKKDTIERQQSITTSEKKFPDNDITTDCKNYDRYIFKKYFEFLSAHTVNDKDAAMITPYSSSKTLIASDDDPFLSNKSLKKKEKRKASKVMTSEIMIPKKSKKSKRQATLVNEYSGKDAPLIASMDKKTYNSDGYVYEGSGKNYKFFCAQGDNMARADINIDPDADTIKTTYFSKSLKDNKENTLLSKTLVKKLKKQKRKHVTVATREEIGPLKNDAMEQKRPITECNKYLENDIVKKPLHTPEMGDTSMTHHFNDYEPVVVEKSFELFSVRDEHQTKDQTVGNEGTSYVINNTNIKSSNVQSSCAPESTRTGKSFIECDICSKTFISKYKLSIHYRTHTGEKPYECDICSRCFTERSTLVSHYRTHTGEKPYECDICNRCFTLRSSLVKHYRTHTGEKPFGCDICSRCFTQRSNLVSHYRTHTGEKPYNCDICSRCFTQRSTLVSHYRTHTGKKP